jgi:hypothetical protein
MEAHSDKLWMLFRRCYPAVNAERFMVLWCELAELCGVSPEELSENDLIAERYSHRRGGLLRTSAMEDIEQLILTESRGQPPPHRIPETVRDVLDYLLLGEPTSAGGARPPDSPPDNGPG